MAAVFYLLFKYLQYRAVRIYFDKAVLKDISIKVLNDPYPWNGFWIAVFLSND